MDNSLIPIALCAVVGLCAILAGFITIFSKDMARRSEQWNREFGQKWGARPPEWFLKWYVPPVYRGVWLILCGSFVLWMIFFEANKQTQERSHEVSSVSVRPQ